MTAYKWSTISSQVAFDPSLDTLLFDDASISAADLVIGGLDAGGPVTISYGGKTISLSYLSFKAITTSRVTFANGSALIVGDDSIGVSGDEGVNDLYGSSKADLFISLGGNDIMHGSGGRDKYLGGLGNDTMYGGGANETFDGGDGVDTVVYYYTYASNVALINYGNGHYKLITPTQGTDDLYNVEKVLLASTPVVLADLTYTPTTGVVATAFAAMVPKVIIWDTAERPYFSAT
jgi:Ca2+-binding RTX toxin-like protein